MIIKYPKVYKTGVPEAKEAKNTGNFKTHCANDKMGSKSGFAASGKTEGGIFKKVLKLIDRFQKTIESGGFFYEFLVVDFAGMIIPRTVQAYLRNRDELGHLNYKAGSEEAIRELLTGPSMFIIPMAFLAIARKKIGTASHVKLDTLRNFKNVAESGIKAAKEPNNIVNSFYKGIVKNLYGNNLDTKQNGMLAGAFTKLHDAYTNPDPLKKADGLLNKLIRIFKKPDPQNVEKAKNHLKDLLIKTNTKIGEDKTHGISLADSSKINLFGKNTSAENMVQDCMNYSTDVLNSLVKSDGNRLSVLEKVHEYKEGARKIITTAAVGTVAAFLYYIPHFYKQNKEFPGIDGLTLKSDNSNVKSAGKGVV